jgi:hypothetical protein
MKVMIVASYVFGHSFARHITSYIAFINIHLDIGSSSYHTDTGRCFGYKDKASAKRKEAVSCFVVYEKKGRCFSPSGQKYKFRPHQSSSYMDEKVEIYHKVWTNFTE